MLKQHGSFAAVEMQIAKKRTKSDSNKVAGGWYTRVALDQNGYTKHRAQLKMFRIDPCSSGR